MPNWLVDALGGILNSVAVVLVAIWSTFFGARAEGASKKRKSNQRFWLLGSVILCVTVSVVFQLGSEYRRHLNDTKTVQYFDEKFNNMTQSRRLAATALLEYLDKGKWNSVTNDTDGLDAVLGFFDTLGYEEQHGGISAKVAHEYFDAHIRAYYQASSEYIAQSQSEKPDSITTFEYVKPLFDDVAKVEARKSNHTIADLRYSERDLIGYLRSETNSVSLKDSK